MQPIPRELLEHPGESLRALTRQEVALRQQYLEPLRPAPADLLVQAANALELHLVMAALFEAVHDLGLRSLSDVLSHLDEICEAACRWARLDVAHVLWNNRDLLEGPSAGPAVGEADHGMRIDRAVRGVSSLLVHVPVDDLEAAARDDPGLATLAHRCRVAYDALRAFVARNQRPERDRARALGRAYAEARLDAADVAAVLGVSVADAVAFLEEGGFARPPELAGLSETAQAEALRRIRDERLRRGGEIVADASLVVRDVVASQRIEGVDARAWVRVP